MSLNITNLVSGKKILRINSCFFVNAIVAKTDLKWDPNLAGSTVQHAQKGPLKSEESDWICDKCGSEVSGKDCTDKIKFLNNHIQGAIEDSKGSIQVYEFVSTNKTCFNKFQDCSSGQFPKKI